MPTSVPYFDFLALLVFWDKEGVLKFNVGATTPCRIPYAETFVCA